LINDVVEEEKIEFTKPAATQEVLVNSELDDHPASAPVKNSIPVASSCLKDHEKLSGEWSFSALSEIDYVFEAILDFFSLEDIYKCIRPLSRRIMKLVEEENYLLLRKLIEKFNISSSYLTSDLPTHERIFDVYMKAMSSINEGKVYNLKPISFYTDSGLVGTNLWYSVHNIFDSNNQNMYGGYVFSSNTGTNNHVQSYLCVPAGGVDNTFCNKMKSEFEVTTGSKEIRFPYEKYPSDGSQPTFKIPKVFEINCRNQGY